MTGPEVTYKKKGKYPDGRKPKRSSVVRNKLESEHLVDKRPKLQKKQEFDKGPKFRWQKINGKVRCPKCKVIYQIGNLIEFRCSWCTRLLWVSPGMQNGVYMKESD